MSTSQASALPQNITNVRSVPMALRLIGRVLHTLDWIAPRLATRLAARMFLTPRHPPRPASESEWCATAHAERRTVAGLPVMIWSRGEGPPILLLHGWEGRGSQLGPLADALVLQGYRVVTPDFPAHGDSSGRRSNLLEFAAITRTLIEELNAPAVIAHSFACAATNLALRDLPSFRGRLVYLAPPEDFEYFTSAFGAMLGLSDNLGDRVARHIERTFDIRWSELRGIALAPRMTAPLLVIHDEDDLDVPVRFGRTLAAAWPGAKLMITNGLGHRRILRHPDVIAAAQTFMETR